MQGRRGPPPTKPRLIRADQPPIPAESLRTLRRVGRQCRGAAGVRIHGDALCGATYLYPFTIATSRMCVVTYTHSGVSAGGARHPAAHPAD